MVRTGYGRKQAQMLLGFINLFRVWNERDGQKFMGRPVGPLACVVDMTTDTAVKRQRG